MQTDYMFWSGSFMYTGTWSGLVFVDWCILWSDSLLTGVLYGLILCRLAGTWSGSLQTSAWYSLVHCKLLLGLVWFFVNWCKF